MKSKVIITANPKTNNVFTPNEKLGKDGKRYGFIRVEQQIVDMSSAVANVKSRSALKSISEEAYNKAKNFLTEGMELKGNIIYKDSLVKQDGYTEKRAGGAEAPVCTINGQPIYRTSVIEEDETIGDDTIQHDNIEEIKAYQATLNTVKIAAKETTTLNNAEVA